MESLNSLILKRQQTRSPHTHHHLHIFFLSLSIVHGYLSSVRMSLKYTQSLLLSSHSCRQTHTHLILLLTYQVMQKTQGKPFFNPGTKTAKCNNLGQKCWHLKMSLAFRQTARSQLKWTEATDRRDRETPDNKRKTDTPSIAIFTHCIVSGPSALIFIFLIFILDSFFIKIPF